MKKRARSRRAEFKSTKLTQKSARDTALALGLFVVYALAKDMSSVDGPCFDEEGNPTERIKKTLFELALGGIYVAMHAALQSGWIDSEVINQTRSDLGLDPIA